MKKLSTLAHFNAMGTGQVVWDTILKIKYLLVRPKCLNTYDQLPCSCVRFNLWANLCIKYVVRFFTNIFLFHVAGLKSEVLIPDDQWTAGRFLARAFFCRRVLLVIAVDFDLFLSFVLPIVYSYIN